MALPDNHPALACDSAHQALYTLPNGTEPLIFLDFKNGVYLVEEASVALATVLIEDGDFGSWNPSRIVNGVGLVGNTDTSPVFTGDTLALITGGSTIVAYFTGTEGDFRFELVDSPDYLTYYSCKAQFGEDGDSLLADNTTTETLPRLGDGYHKIALTMIDGKMALSTDGGSVVEIDPADPWTPDVAIMNMIVAAGVTLETIGLYPAQPDGDLPMLSTP